MPNTPTTNGSTRIDICEARFTSDRLEPRPPARRFRRARLGLLWRRAYLAVRITAAIAVTGLLWGWGVGQYPELLPGLSLAEAVANDAVLVATLGALAVGAVLIILSLGWLSATFQRGSDASGTGSSASGIGE